MTYKRMFGLDLHSQDGKVLPPTVTELEPDELYKWFFSWDNAQTVPIRILCVQLGENPQKSFEQPLPKEVIEHAIWGPEVYYNLNNNATGGAAGLIDEPYRFILQTPRDGGPFCSLAMSRKGILVKGIYFFDSDSFNPELLKGAETGRSGWRSSGLQIITLPEMFLRAHAVQTSERLTNLIDRINEIENVLAVADQTPSDLSPLSRSLHSCHSTLIDLERRSRFEETVIKAIETIVGASQHGKLPWPSLTSEKASVESRTFDFESLPRRIENARATISTIIQQRNETLNLEMTQASFRIAEATFEDSKSMKTIAILTMIVLPGTAIASIFSMSMFDWSAKDGGQIASKWLWIYFALSVPLTGLILIVWWIWTRRLEGRSLWRRKKDSDEQLPAFKDDEAALGSQESGESVEMHTVVPKAGAEG